MIQVLHTSAEFRGREDYFKNLMNGNTGKKKIKKLERLDLFSILSLF